MENSFLDLIPRPERVVRHSPTGTRSRIRPGILVVDDEAAVRSFLKAALELQGFTVWLAEKGVEAVDLYARQRSAIDLVLLDVRMPGLDGPHTLAALRRLDPDVRCCFMSGHTGEYTEAELLLRGAACVFAKPFRLSELGALLCRQIVAVECLGA